MIVVCFDEAAAQARNRLVQPGETTVQRACRATQSNMGGDMDRIQPQSAAIGFRCFGGTFQKQKLVYLAVPVFARPAAEGFAAD